MRETQLPNLLFYPRTVLLVTPRFYPPFREASILMQRKVLRWHPAHAPWFKRQPVEHELIKKQPIKSRDAEAIETS